MSCIAIQLPPLLAGAGVFLYPLAIFCAVSTFVIIERCLALRKEQVLPHALQQKLLKGNIPELKDLTDDSMAERLVQFYLQEHPDPETLKAFARLELTGLERGFFILDLVVGVSPLMGLLGTVTGLVGVFGNLAPGAAGAMPSPETLMPGIAMALSTTVLGLTIAIPALIAHAALTRRVDCYASQMDWVIESLDHRTRRSLENK